MQRKVVQIMFAVLLGAGALFAQSANKPSITSITGLPSEPVKPTGTCKVSTQGYLEVNHRTNLSQKQIGKLISKFVHDGYIVTIYPPTKDGIFVDLECTNATAAATP